MFARIYKDGKLGHRRGQALEDYRVERVDGCTDLGLWHGSISVRQFQPFEMMLTVSSRLAVNILHTDGRKAKRAGGTLSGHKIVAENLYVQKTAWSWKKTRRSLYMAHQVKN